jgi:molybdate transport system permease protein
MTIPSALSVSAYVTLMAAVAILLVGLPVALFLARARSRMRHFFEVLLLFPLLMPPTVLGYFLLVVLGKGSPLVDWFGFKLLFTPYGAAVAGAVVGLPLMVFTSRAAIGAVDPRLEDVARTLGANELEVFRDVTLPLAGRGILAGMLLATARATGEFGATLMVAGSIPDRTRTLPIALYESIQLGDSTTATGIVILLSAVVLIVVVLLHFLESDFLRWRS